ncbi:MAG TPA: hypothetical protein VD969_29035 [Symbiobacteriaceae bacterium]|nr:hypothetical protein [Symbiobacteriaceae bacterium]
MITWQWTLPPLSRFRAPHLAVPGVFHRLDGALAETWLTLTGSDGQCVGFCLLLRERDAEGRRWLRLEGAEVFPPEEEAAAHAMLDLARKIAARESLAGVRLLHANPLADGLYPSSDTWFGAGTAGCHLVPNLEDAGAAWSEKEVLLRLPLRHRTDRHVDGALHKDEPPACAGTGAPAGERHLLGLSVAWRLTRGDARAFALACPNLGPEVLATGSLPRSAPFAGRPALLWNLQAQSFSPLELAGFVLDVASSLASAGPSGLYVHWPVDGALPLLLEAGAEIASRISEWRLPRETPDRSTGGERA